MHTCFVQFLGNGVSRKNAFEIYGPLDLIPRSGVHTQAGYSWLTQAGFFLWPTQACRNINHNLLSQALT